MLRFLLATAWLAAGTTSSSSGTLDDLRWKNRVLLLFSARTDDPVPREQEALLLAGKAALADRDMAVATIEGDRLTTLFGPSSALETVADLRERLSIDRPASFVIVLIGKDGGTKWRADRPTSLTDIIFVIDAMPMRRTGR